MNHMSRRVILPLAVALAALMTFVLLLAQPRAAGAQVDSLTVQLVGGRTVIQGIHFVKATDRITPASGAHLARLAKLLAARPDTFLIEGHTDNTGNPAADQALSEKRAAVVKSRLMAEGVSGARLFVAGFGATRPLTIPGGESGSPGVHNARIEVVQVRR
ncbi:MAG: OmpA family protein [Anaerolineae bacterium]|nr:OmpA family protein [Gemmatimonadaceae bacterium]